MSIKVVVHGEVLDLADELQDDFHRDAKAVVEEGAGMLLGDVQRRLRQRSGTFRTAAPEGEAPEFDVGDLYRSFKLIAPRVTGRVATSGIRSDHPGANRLEYGKTDVRGIRTLPHPYLRPAMEAMEEPIGRLLQERLG
jgi:hypothetical protein